MAHRYVRRGQEHHIGCQLIARFREAGAKVELLDGDIVRTNLSQGLGFSPRRSRYQYPAHRFCSGSAFTQRHHRCGGRDLSLSRDARGSEIEDRATSSKCSSIAPWKFWLSAMSKVSTRRALAGEVGNFTGISDPYEPPLHPDVTVRSDRETLEESVGKIWSELTTQRVDRGGMIDLHSHTDQSDGTFTAAELVAEAARIGLKALAITDHDTMSGYDLAVPFAAGSRTELICGIELSTKFHGVSVHLLGYFPARLPSAGIPRMAGVSAGKPPRP